MKNTIYTVKAGNGVGKLNATEKAIYEFLVTSSYEVGHSIGSQKFVKQFADWNDDKMTVKAGSIASASNLKKVCKAIASSVLNDGLVLASIPVVRANKAHGNFSIDFVSVDNVANEYTANELKVIEKKQVSAMEFLTAYISKHEEEIDFAVLSEFLKDFQ